MMLKDTSESAKCSLHRDVLCAIALGLFKESKRYQATQAVLNAGGFTPVEQLLSKSDLAAAEVIATRCKELNLAVLPITSKFYPELLRQISSPPPALYVHALNYPVAFSDLSIGVVGTRAASIQVCHTASELGCSLASSGLTVVSGLALGIDGAAHRGALQSGLECPTIAVLAHGLDRVYPPSHIGLAREILSSGGVIISEYAPGIEPLRHHFLARNRIIAGLSRGVVVVQAGARSGSLVTANFAADFGRDVFIVQDSSGDERSLGGSGLIEQGAIAISSAEDVLREYNLVKHREDALGDASWSTTGLDSFMALTSSSPSDVLKLELAGSLVRLPGNQVRYRVGLVG